jgi:catechol 2,3-dioxygenase-like lactoylglutathione lyase family enzyme
VFTIGKNFHIIHMNEDLTELDAWYDDVFGVERWMDHQFSDGLKRYGSLVQIGDLCIEPMAPSLDVEGWDQVAVGRFWRRFGQRWHSIAWYVPTKDDFDEAYRTFRANDVHILGGLGDRADDQPPTGAMFTHPRDTITQLEFIVAPQPGGMGGMQDPRFTESFDPARWTAHPLGITKSSHVTLTVRDQDRGKRVYGELLGGTFLHEGEQTITGTQSSFFSVGEDLVVELATPLEDTSAIGADLVSNGEGIYAVTYRVKDLEATEAYLSSKGVKASVNDGTTLLTDPATSRGVVMGFTTWEIPNDPRPSW